MIWRCRKCGRATTIEGSDADVACCVGALEARHARGHGAAEHAATDPSMRAVRRYPPERPGRHEASEVDPRQ